MEFEELQQIWDSQNKRPLYIINEEALHNRILTKKSQATHITNFSELLLIAVNTGAGALVLWSASSDENIVLYLLSGWMIVTTIFTTVSRIRRIKGEKRYDRSMQGDLQYALSVASYQVRLSQIMRWNVIPIATLCLFGIWEGEKSIWIALGIFLLFALAYYASGWEHNIYKSRKKELEILRDKLEREVSKEATLS